MMQCIFNNRNDRKSELAKADRLAPETVTWSIPAKSVVTLDDDPGSWQHTKAVAAYPADLLKDKILSAKERLVLDFGETLVGKVRLKLESPQADSPVRLRILAAELPYEAKCDPETFDGGLGRAWLQEELITAYDFPAEIELPNRYSLRYLVINVLSCPHRSKVKITRAEVIARSAVCKDLPRPLPQWDNELALIDAACARTLRNCMQKIAEDGPKRDRRLWLGDLRLQALVNHVTFQRYDQIERSIRIRCACKDDRGMIPGAVIMRPEPHNSSFILDYSLLFSRLLLEHCRFSGDLDIGGEFFPIAEKQLTFYRDKLDKDGSFNNPGYWLFIDHCDELDRSTPIACTAIRALESLAELAKILNMPESKINRLQEETVVWRNTLRRSSFDTDSGMLSSGSSRQFSWASQIWGILAGVLSPEEGRCILQDWEKRENIIKPVSPYLMHYLLEAFRMCGMENELTRTIRSYWGGMIKHGADTFWEVYLPDDDFFTPYGSDPRNNSACHAWSGTPGYFLRTIPER